MAGSTREAPPVFVTENEVYFLAFPGIEDGRVAFGNGHGFQSLHRAQWLVRYRLS